MSLTKIVVFDRRLEGAASAHRPARTYTESEVAALKEEAHRQGENAGRAFADRQLVDLRADLQRLLDGILPNLSHLEGNLLAELRSSLPDLALDLARRLLAGYEPPPEVVERICREALDQLYPERENLEIILSETDATMLSRLAPGWMQQYPGLTVQPNPLFVPGDCQVRSRFGLTDARLSTKVQALTMGLTGS